MAYYGSLYNRDRKGTPIRGGDTVEIYDEAIPGRDPELVGRGRVAGFDNRKASDGYTVLVKLEPDEYRASYRPEELKVVL